MALRESRGLSQAQLADRLGITQSAIAQLESAQPKNIELRTLVRVATALGGHVDVSIRARRQAERSLTASAAHGVRNSKRSVRQRDLALDEAGFSRSAKPSDTSQKACMQPTRDFKGTVQLASRAFVRASDPLLSSLLTYGAGN